MRSALSNQTFVTGTAKEGGSEPSVTGLPESTHFATVVAFSRVRAAVSSDGGITSAPSQSEGTGNRLSFSRIVSAGFVQTNGFGSALFFWM